MKFLMANSLLQSKYMRYHPLFIAFWFCILQMHSYGQGRAKNWLLGYTSAVVDTEVVSNRALISFDSLNVNVSPKNFQMAFRAAQANISDEDGNLLFVSNGCWVADSSGNQMQNGALAQSGTWASWCTPSTGIPFNQSIIALPDPGDTAKYYLIQQVSTFASFATDIIYSVVDMNLAGGLGGIPANQKQLPLLNASQNNNIVACKHANGRDWWFVTFKHLTDTLCVFLLDPSGISGPFYQSIGINHGANEIGQSQFSPDGNYFAYETSNYSAGIYLTTARLLNFNRCTGVFSNLQVFNYTDSALTLGLMFSPSSNYLYVASLFRIYQFDVSNFASLISLDTVAINDGYYSPYPPFQTGFWIFYRAANGKIYGSSGNAVIDLHYINYPDSAGLACDVRQHALHLPCFSGRGNVNHPNYYLGCDTTLGCPCLVSTGVNEYGKHDFSIKLSPNPGSAGFEILYLLPQNKNGNLSVYDLQGRLMHKQILPQWSTMQHIPASDWAPGIYQVRIESDLYTRTVKWVKY